VTFPTAKNKQDRFYCTYFRWGRYDLQLQECTDGKWYYMGTSIRNTEWVGGTAMADASAAHRRAGHLRILGAGAGHQRDLA